MFHLIAERLDENLSGAKSSRSFALREFITRIDKTANSALIESWSFSPNKKPKYISIQSRWYVVGKIIRAIPFLSSDDRSVAF